MAGRIGLWVLAFGALGVLGCAGPDHEDFCKRWSTCVGGNDKDVDACIAQADYSEESSDLQGCTEEYVEYFDCVSDHSTCQEGRYVLPSEDVCRKQASAYNNCGRGVGWDFEP